jgi:hypothetical protein
MGVKTKPSLPSSWSVAEICRFYGFWPLNPVTFYLEP